MCLSTNRNMLVPAFFAAAEAARRARATHDGGAYDVHVFIEAADLDDTHRRWMEAHGIRTAAAPDCARLRAIDIPDKRFTWGTLMRLLMPAALAGRYDRVLHLDADIEICGDIAGLFRLDLGGAPVAAVPAARIAEVVPRSTLRRREAHFRELGMTEPFGYFNAGVMLIDIARWMAEDIGERALAFVERNTALCPLADEDALNAVIDGRIAEISPIWNLRSWEMAMPGVPGCVVPAIRHYDGPHKPWKRFAHNRRLFSLEAPYRRYRRFVAETPWRDWLARQWSARDLRDNIRFELQILGDRLRGRRTKGVRTRAMLRRHFEFYRRYLQDKRFADVEQGIAVRRDGRLMPNDAAAGSAA